MSLPLQNMTTMTETVDTARKAVTTIDGRFDSSELGAQGTENRVINAGSGGSIISRPARDTTSPKPAATTIVSSVICATQDENDGGEFIFALKAVRPGTPLACKVRKFLKMLGRIYGLKVSFPTPADIKSQGLSCNNHKTKGLGA